MNQGHALFDELAEAWLTKPGISRSTMMGFPCLRVEGQFFASVDREGERLVIKLSKEQVRDLVDAGLGEPFAPNGRTFKEWVAIPRAVSETWPEHLDQAYAFVSGKL